MLIFAAVAMSLACGPSAAPTLAPPVSEAVPAPIESSALQIAESFPLQYFVRVVSGLPDGCHSFGGYTLARDGFRVTIKVSNYRTSGSISSINRGKGAKQLAKTRPGSVPWPALQ